MIKEDGMFGLAVETANSVANWVYLLAGAIAVLSTATTVAASWVMWKTSTQISEEKDRQLAHFQAYAKEKTAVLENETANANTQAALANKAAEDERIERLKLEIKLAPRTLGGQGVDVLASGMARFSGIDIDIVAYEYLGTDIAPLAQDISASFEKAGAASTIFTPFPGSGWVRGVLVRTADDAGPEIVAASDAIVLALNQVGIASGKWPTFKPDEHIAGAYNAPQGKTPTHKIRVLIGSKP